MAAQPKQLYNTYTAPAQPHLRSIIITGIIMALSARKEVISPGSLLYDHLLSRSSTALKIATWIQNGLFYFLFGAHSIETVIFARRLSKHGVNFLGLAWWKWMVTCFIGGKFCFEHFDQLVGAKA